MRLIDADALADALFDKRKNYPQWVADVIGNMPVIDALELLKEPQAETIECKMCGHRLQKDWSWCPWCRWEIRQGYNADELS